MSSNNLPKHPENNEGQQQGDSHQAPPPTDNGHHNMHMENGSGYAPNGFTNYQHVPPPQGDGNWYPAQDFREPGQSGQGQPGVQVYPPSGYASMGQYFYCFPPVMQGSGNLEQPQQYVYYQHPSPPMMEIQVAGQSQQPAYSQQPLPGFAYVNVPPPSQPHQSCNEMSSNVNRPCCNVDGLFLKMQDKHRLIVRNREAQIYDKNLFIDKLQEDLRGVRNSLKLANQENAILQQKLQRFENSSTEPTSHGNSPMNAEDSSIESVQDLSEVDSEIQEGGNSPQSLLTPEKNDEGLETSPDFCEQTKTSSKMAKTPILNSSTILEKSLLVGKKQPLQEDGRVPNGMVIGTKCAQPVAENKNAAPLVETPILRQVKSDVQASGIESPAASRPLNRPSLTPIHCPIQDKFIITDEDFPPLETASEARRYVMKRVIFTQSTPNACTRSKRSNGSQEKANSKVSCSPSTSNSMTVPITRQTRTFGIVDARKCTTSSANKQPAPRNAPKPSVSRVGIDGFQVPKQSKVARPEAGAQKNPSVETNVSSKVTSSSGIKGPTTSTTSGKQRKLQKEASSQRMIEKSTAAKLVKQATVEPQNASTKGKKKADPIPISGHEKTESVLVEKEHKVIVEARDTPKNNEDLKKVTTEQDVKIEKGQAKNARNQSTSQPKKIISKTAKKNEKKYPTTSTTVDVRPPGFFFAIKEQLAKQKKEVSHQHIALKAQQNVANVVSNLKTESGVVQESQSEDTEKAAEIPKKPMPVPTDPSQKEEDKRITEELRNSLRCYLEKIERYRYRVLALQREDDYLSANVLLADIVNYSKTMFAYGVARIYRSVNAPRHLSEIVMKYRKRSQDHQESEEYRQKCRKLSLFFGVLLIESHPVIQMDMTFMFRLKCSDEARDQLEEEYMGMIEESEEWSTKSLDLDADPITLEDTEEAGRDIDVSLREAFCRHINGQFRLRHGFGDIEEIPQTPIERQAFEVYKNHSFSSHHWNKESTAKVLENRRDFLLMCPMSDENLLFVKLYNFLLYFNSSIIDFDTCLLNYSVGSESFLTTDSDFLKLIFDC